MEPTFCFFGCINATASAKIIGTAVMLSSQHKVTGHGIQEPLQGEIGNTSAMIEDQKEKRFFSAEWKTEA